MKGVRTAPKGLVETERPDPFVKGSSILCGLRDGTFMRPLQGRTERVLGLPRAASRLGGTCPRPL